METRIQKLINSENITPTKFADILGVQRSAISHILSGRNKPSFDLIQKILTKFPRVSAEWLIMGRHEIYKTTIQQKLFDFESSPPITNLLVNHDEKNVNQQDVEEINSSKELKDKIFEKNVEQVIILYNDKSFNIYNPSK